MTNLEYQIMVEKKFNKPLKEIMYEVCVNKDVIASEGASILEVPDKVFKIWRDKFRLGPLQRRADAGERMQKENLEKYKSELQDVNLNRKFKYADTKSLDGFKEMLERLLEVMKASKVKDSYEGLESSFSALNIIIIEQTINYVESYLSGELGKQIEFETNLLNELLNNKFKND